MSALNLEHKAARLKAGWPAENDPLANLDLPDGYTAMMPRADLLVVCRDGLAASTAIWWPARPASIAAVEPSGLLLNRLAIRVWGRKPIWSHEDYSVMT